MLISDLLKKELSLQHAHSKSYRQLMSYNFMHVLFISNSFSKDTLSDLNEHF